MQYGFGYSQGTERYLSILQRGLRERGLDSIVLAGDPEGRGGADRPQLGQLRDYDLPLRAYPTYGWMAVRGVESRRLAPWLRELRPDLIHLANPAHIGVGLIDAARDLQIPLVVTVMDYWWLCPKSTLVRPDGALCDARVTWSECLACIAASRPGSTRQSLARLPGVRSVALPTLYFSRWLTRGVPPQEIAAWTRRQTLLRSALERVAAIIFPSRAARELVGAQVQNANKASIPYGLEPHWFENHTPRPRQPPVRVVGFAGALEPHKGPHRLLEAARMLGSRVQLRLAGAATDAAYEQRLRELANGLDVQFVGRVAASAMPKFMSELDLLVVPSQWPENLPIVVLEAYASGLPVIAARVGGIAEIVPGHALFDYQRPEQLTERLRNWIDHPQAFASLPAVSTAEEMVARTAEVYAACLGRAQAVAPPSGAAG